MIKQSMTNPAIIKKMQRCLTFVLGPDRMAFAKRILINGKPIKFLIQLEKGKSNQKKLTTLTIKFFNENNQIFRYSDI